MRTHSGAEGICEKLATKRKGFTMLYIMLNTPYAEKDEAKKAGARWSKNAKRWYIDPKTTDLEDVSRWCDVKAAKCQMSEYGRLVKDLCSMMSEWGRGAGIDFPYTDHLPEGAFDPMKARYISTRAGALFHALKTDAGVEEAKAMNRDLFFYIGDSDCMDVLDLLDDAVEGLAKRCRAMDCIETYV